MRINTRTNKRSNREQQRNSGRPWSALLDAKVPLWRHPEQALVWLPLWDLVVGQVATVLWRGCTFAGSLLLAPGGEGTYLATMPTDIVLP